MVHREADVLDALAQIERLPAVTEARLTRPAEPRPRQPPLLVVLTTDPLTDRERHAVDEALAYHLPPNLIQWRAERAPTPDPEQDG